MPLRQSQKSSSWMSAPGTRPQAARIDQLIRRIQKEFNITIMLIEARYELGRKEVTERIYMWNMVA